MKSIFCCIALIIAQLSCGQIPKPLRNTYVNDFAGVLTKAQITDLNKSIFELEKAHQVQLAIVLVNKVPAAYDIQDFAVLIGKKWHVGINKRGIVYVAAIAQHKQRIEVARNLDSIFKTARCLEIMAEMKTPFRAQDYKAGLDILVNSISAAMPPSIDEQNRQQAEAERVQAKAKADAIAKQKADDAANTRFWSIVFVIGAILFVIYWFLRYQSRRAALNRPVDYDRPGYNNPGYNNPGYGGPGYGGGYGYQQPNHTLRNVAAGAALGYAARAIQDRITDYHNHDAANIPDTPPPPPDDNEANEPSNWGNWGGDSNSSSSSSDDSSYDSGFSDDSSSSNSGSSDSSSDSSSSGATSDW